MNFRPGASTGILLGAVTLPAVMLSKLIQLSRAFSFHELESAGTSEALILASNGFTIA